MLHCSCRRGAWESTGEQWSLGSHMSGLIGKKLGQFEVVEQIEQGGMATIHKAYQPEMDRFVAIKVLPAPSAQDPTFMVRFVREARAIAELYHAHIVPVHDFGEHDGTTYIVME
jgi:eukaryotic-like serine/threonine-protein kinase